MKSPRIDTTDDIHCTQAAVALPSSGSGTHAARQHGVGSPRTSYDVPDGPHFALALRSSPSISLSSSSVKRSNEGISDLAADVDDGFRFARATICG